jgi:N-acetyl-anhydromuramyl-L-alanine amidase AmpD
MMIAGTTLAAVMGLCWATPTPLVIVKRAAWDPAPLHAGTRYPGRLRDVYTTIVVHHSDMVESPGPLAIKEYHLQVSKFADIGYHFVIEPDGTVYEGRDLDRVGAHAGAVAEQIGHPEQDPDWGAVGIVMDGLFESTTPTPAALSSLEKLIDDLRGRFPKIARVIGHREVAPELVRKKLKRLTSKETTCPGDAMFLWLEEHRRNGDFDAKPQPLVKLEVAQIVASSAP